MLKIICTLLLTISFIFVSHASANSYEDTPKWIKNLPDAQDANQMIVVAGMGGTTAWISMHEKDASGNWMQIMTTPGFIGKNGFGKVSEGDYKTPTGTFRITKAFGIASDPGCQIPYTQVDDNIYWSGDVNCKYNELVDIREYPKLKKSDSEHLIDYAPTYNYCLNINYNEFGNIAKGSAIFLTCFDKVRPWTAGGITLPESQMLTIMQHVKQDCVIIINTLKNLHGTF